MSAPHTLFPAKIYFFTSYVLASTTATWLALPNVTNTKFFLLAYAKSTGVICCSLIPFIENLIVFFNSCTEVSITSTVPLSSLLTQYSFPLLTNSPLLGLLPTSISFTIILLCASIMSTELVPSEVT